VRVTPLMGLLLLHLVGAASAVLVGHSGEG
jgi:hypothetical protein